ncbi:hypothetical protein DL769_009240 [Monosporascus sp. CRB-8-3]|nr:hypothetical protein DL769_009240 [Monosporascus sp. CRB-8-3]
MVLKIKYDAFDGRGNLKIPGEVDPEQAVIEFGNLSCYAEKRVSFELELSVVVIGTQDDEGKTKRLILFPADETVQEGNICSRVFMSPQGVPANFKAQLVSILNEPLLEELELHVPSSVMINILEGRQLGFPSAACRKAKSTYSKKMAVYLRLHGKEYKPSRGIGHITIAGFASIAERLQASSKALRPQQEVKPPAKAKGEALVPVTMGSDTGIPVLKAGIDVLRQFNVPWEVDITSAHRTPAHMGQIATDAAARGIKAIIAAAGGAAHLPGMLAAYTRLPVTGVLLKAKKPGRTG